VHCGSGAQRTSTATLLYRMVIENQSAAEAYRESFNYGHKPDEWVLLAWVADHIDYVRARYHEQAAARSANLTSS
jgi:hypothetical protein